jgi:iron(III) transport system substrate-binding protein
VVYTSQDQIYSEAILQAFTGKTGIEVRPVYDTEAAKTVGLINRIVAEAPHPRCDVLWNSEAVRTVMLKKKGLLQPYASPSASDIPPAFKDKDGFWTGFAGRARVLICNTNLLAEADIPGSILELTQPKWRGKVALAYPLFGTTATHGAALFAALGDAQAAAHYQALQSNGVIIVDGNATAKDLVARGEVPVAFTDSDDANVALRDGKPVRMVLPDQGPDQLGALIIPNTVALIRDCPHPENGKRLIDYLLSREVEKAMIECGAAQMPVRADIPPPRDTPSLAGIKAMDVDWNQVETKLTDVSHFTEQLFVR